MNNPTHDELFKALIDFVPPTRQASTKTPTITSQAALRRLFWNTHDFPKVKIRAGRGLVWQADTRGAFSAMIDTLEKSGQIGHQLGNRATL